jgi:cysteine-rich repeat protein
MGIRGALILFISGCGVDLALPAAPLQITCETDSECPGDMICLAEIGRCAATGSTCLDRAGDRSVAVEAGTPCALGAAERGICLDGECRESRCGDAFTDTEVLEEECDAGAANSDTEEDACRTDCQRAWCGDGVLDRGSGEQCDDGPLNADLASCSPDCTRHCGDGWQQPLEECDDGNLADGDGCDHDCTDTGCGNRIPTAGEECDDGNLVDGDGCDTNCTNTACGNGIETDGEVCDDGDNESGDDCSGDCQSDEQCANGIIDWIRGEGCDDGVLNSNAPNARCRIGCQPRACGDGIIDDAAGEDCDGGVPAGLDCVDRGFYAGTLRCTSCRIDTSQCSGFCGDGQLDAGEQCDREQLGDAQCTDAGFYGGTLGCLGNCTFNLSECAGRCGDGVLNGSEICDGSDFGGETCLSYTTALGSPRYSGPLACDPGCDAIDSSSCREYCGDGIKNGAEVCDTDDFGGLVCGNFNYYGGTPTCASECGAIDTASCEGYCGDGEINGAEQCDGVDTDGLTCSEVSSSYVGGSLSCDAFCRRGEALCYGERWTAVRPEVIDSLFPSAGLTDVWSSPDGQTFVVGEAGTVLRFDGRDWTTIPTGLSLPLTHVWGRAADDFWVAGSTSAPEWRIMHYDGNAWTTSLSGTTERYQFTDMWGDASADVLFVIGWVGGNTNGVVLRRAGGTWGTTILTDGVPSNWHRVNGIWGVDATDVYAVGFNPASTGGRVWRFNGATWSVFADNLAQPLYDVTGTSATSMYAAAGNGSIFTYNGSSWREESRLSPGGFYAIWAPQPGEVFVGGSFGVIVHLESGYWTRMETGTTQQFAGFGGTSRADVFAVGSSKTLLRYQMPPWRQVTIPATIAQLYDIDGPAMDDFFIVGAAAQILRYRQGVWSTMQAMLPGPTPLQTFHTIYDVDVVSPTVAFAAASNGKMLFWDGVSWTATAVPGTSAAFQGVFARSANDAWAVTAGGDLYRFDGASWTLLSNSGFLESLHELWVTDTDEVIAAGTSGSGVGSRGFIKRFDGVQWTEELGLAPYGQQRPGLWGTSDGNLFASFTASDSRIFHYDGFVWEELPAFDGYSVYGLGGSSAGDVIALGQATVSRFDGSSWSSIKPNTFLPIYAALTDGSSLIVAGGDNGAVFALDGAFPRDDGGPCADPVRVYCGGVAWGDTHGGADHVSSYGSCASSRPGDDAFFLFDAPIDGTITVRLTPYEADLDLFVLRADTLGRCDATCDGSSTETGLAPEQVTLTPVVGRRYYLAVEGNGAPSAFTLRVECDKR